MKPNKKTETTMLDRRNWLKAWIKLRNYDIGIRADNFLFCYHCTNRALYSPELSWQLLQSMNNQLIPPLPMENLIKIAAWNMLRITNEKIIRQLGITEEEVARLRIGHSCIYEQIPVVLAYAITANKSEGMTFKEVNIVPGFFAPGQLYTALSRCTSVDGIYIHGELTPKDLHVDIEALRMTIDEA